MLLKLNNSIYRFKKDRILSKLKSGRAIPKFLWGSIINNIEANNQLMQQEFVLPVIDYSSQIVSRGASKKAAERKLNRKVKAPMKPADNSILELLDKMWRAGAFKGVKDRRGRELTYEKAVDGIDGPLTLQVLANMKSINSLKTINLNNTLNPLEDALRLSVRMTDVYADRFNRILGEEDIKSGNVLTLRSLKPFNTILHKAYSNAYPYSYGDVITNGKEVIPYSRYDYPDGIPEGYKLVLTTAETPKDIQSKSMLYKLTDALKGEDPRTTFMKQLAQIDLSTPEGKQYYAEMLTHKPQGFIRGGGNPENAQFEMRARLDASNAYDNNGLLLYNTWEYNPDYDSPTAKARGRATYRIKDPKLRERIYGEMTNYFLKHKGEGHWKDDDPNSGIYILPHMGFMGNLSLIADDENGLNLRYGDWWDYLKNPTDAYVMYMGDRLVPEGTYPKWYRNRQVGHNTREMAEAFDGNYVKELSKSLLGLRKGGNLSYNPVKKFKLCFINLKNLLL